MYKKLSLPVFLLIASVLLFFSCKTPPVYTPQELIRMGEIVGAKNRFVSENEINGVDSKGESVLHVAAEVDNPELISYFIFKGADLEMTDRKGNTPLITAVKNNSYESARTLTEAGANIFAVDGDGMTAIDLAFEAEDPTLFYDVFINQTTGKMRDIDGRTIVHYFVEKDNLEGIQQCVWAGLPLSEKDDLGKTPVDYAFAKSDDLQAVYIAAELIMGGADEVETDFAYFQDALTNRNFSLRFDDGQTPLHLSAINGHVAITQYLLENEADTTLQDSTGATPLHEAVRYGNVEVAGLLIEAGANVNALDNIGKTPILLVPPKSKVQELYSLLISAGTNLLHKDMYGDTVLHTATLMEVDPDTLAILVDNGADVDAKNKDGITPLETAVIKRNVPIIEYIASLGADIHSKDSSGQSPLLLALTDSNDVFEALINEENVTFQDTEGNTALHVALTRDAELAKVQYLLSLTNDVNIRNRDGNSALYIAVMKNRHKAGEILLEKNADIFSTNTNGNSPLQMALKYGGSVQDWLITSKTIKATDGSGNTVLHYAAEWQYEKAISFLLTKGADVSARNANGETPLFTAAKTNNVRVIQLLLDGGASPLARDNLGCTPIHTAVRWDAKNSIGKLIDAGVDVNSTNSAGRTPLADAVLAVKIEIAEYLIRNGAYVNACDSNGVTILMDAVKNQNKEGIKLLIKYNASINMQDINGRNAYHEAALTYNKDIIRLIRNAGGNPLGRDKKGNTPFTIVINKSNDIILEVLGNDGNIVDSDGNTPIHLAVKNSDSPNLIKMLIAAGFPVDIRNASGYTPLAYAIEENNVAKSLVLLQNNANPFQMIDKKGKTPVTIALDNPNEQIIANIIRYAGKMSDSRGNSILHYAAKQSSANIITLMLSYGLDRDVKNAAGETPAVIAKRWKRPDIVALLDPSAPLPTSAGTDADFDDDAASEDFEEDEV